MQITLEEFSRAHIPRLSQFVCTSPAKAERWAGYREPQHPSPWELEVQSYFRSRRFPLVDEEVWIITALLGQRKVLIGAVGLEINIPENWALIKAVAIAQDFKGHSIASRVLPRLISFLRENRQWMIVQANVHYKNVASRRLFERLGFECVEYDGDYEVWELPVDP